MANQFSQALRKEAEQPPAKEAATPKAAPAGGKTTVKPGREGKRNITGYFAPPVAKQFKQLALTQDVTVQDLLAEAINDIFAKYRLPQIARQAGKG